MSSPRPYSPQGSLFFLIVQGLFGSVMGTLVRRIQLCARMAYPATVALLPFIP